MVIIVNMRVSRKKGYPKMDGLSCEIISKWMIWGYPHLWKLLIVLTVVMKINLSYQHEIVMMRVIRIMIMMTTSMNMIG